MSALRTFEKLYSQAMQLQVQDSINSRVVGRDGGAKDFTRKLRYTQAMKIQVYVTV